jgi:molybdate transport system substrate-binding protein
MDGSITKILILPILAVALCVVIVAFLVTFQGVAEKQTTTITVSAASSLTEGFTDIEKEFEAAHPDTNVELNLAGSGTLRTQIESGSPVDVFASASESDMDLLSNKNLMKTAQEKILQQMCS